MELELEYYFILLLFVSKLSVIPIPTRKKLSSLYFCSDKINFNNYGKKKKKKTYSDKPEMCVKKCSVTHTLYFQVDDQPIEHRVA